MSRKFEDCIYLPNKIFKSIGYDFLDKSKSKWRKGIMRLYLITSLLCCLCVTYYVIIATINEFLAGIPNLPALNRLITDINYNVIAFLKTIYFVRHLQKNKRICKEFEDIFPKSRKEQQQYCVQDYVWPKWIKILLFFYFGSVLFITLLPITVSIFDYLIQYFKLGYANATFAYKTTYEVDYAMDRHNPLGYCIIYTVELLNGHYAMILNICPDIWLVAYALQLCMHFDCIAKSMESYEPLEAEYVKNCQFIGVLVRKHHIILDLSEKLREIFSELILIMFFSTAVTFCTAGVYIIAQGVSVDLLGFLAFLPISLAEYLMICYYGQQIINKSFSVREATYNSLWYNGSQSYKKCILIILQRTQRQAELNAGGFQTTNLEAFKAVMSFTYSVFTMLNTMFSKSSG